MEAQVVLALGSININILINELKGIDESLLFF